MSLEFEALGLTPVAKLEGAQGKPVWVYRAQSAQERQTAQLKKGRPLEDTTRTAGLQSNAPMVAGAGAILGSAVALARRLALAAAATVAPLLLLGACATREPPPPRVPPPPLATPAQIEREMHYLQQHFLSDACLVELSRLAPELTPKDGQPAKAIYALEFAPDPQTKDGRTARLHVTERNRVAYLYISGGGGGGWYTVRGPLPLWRCLHGALPR